VPRQRFAREVIAAVRREVGDRPVVGLRLCCDELAPWAGIRREEGPELAFALSEGVDYVSVVAGSIYSVEETRPGLHRPPGHLLALCTEVRRRLGGIPVFASGGLVDPAQASAAITTGQADACEMTRALIADPDLPSKLARQRAHEIRPCIRCNQDCSVRSAANAVVSCIHNPEAGYEVDWPPLTRAARRRHVVVVGGGPAGLEAALTAASRGHRVTLLERGPLLGGVPRTVAEAGQRQPFGLVSSWRAGRLASLDVEVQLAVQGSPEAIGKLSPDVVIAATGARTRPPEGLPGAELPHVVSVRDALTGILPGSERVVVIDRQGTYPAIDVARLAAGSGRAVTIVSEDPFVSSQLAAIGELSPWYRHAALLGIALRPLTTVLEITRDSVLVRHRFGTEQDRLDADCVVVADYEVPDDALYRQLPGALPGLEVRRVGDCLAPRRVLHAVLEGGRAGREV